MICTPKKFKDQCQDKMKSFLFFCHQQVLTLSSNSLQTTWGVVCVVSLPFFSKARTKRKGSNVTSFAEVRVCKPASPALCCPSNGRPVLMVEKRDAWHPGIWHCRNWARWDLITSAAAAADKTADTDVSVLLSIWQPLANNSKLLLFAAMSLESQSGKGYGLFSAL